MHVDINFLFVKDHFKKVNVEKSSKTEYFFRQNCENLRFIRFSTSTFEKWCLAKADIETDYFRLLDFNFKKTLILKHPLKSDGSFY